MLRIDFLSILTGGIVAMNNLNDLQKFTTNLSEEDSKMPVFFIGHGSPMNGIEINEFSQNWASLVKDIQHPKAVLCISAHWLTRGTRVTAMNNPGTIHDFSGFPQELYDVEYAAAGNPELAKEISSTIKNITVEHDHEWGLDHGCWTVVRHMYPKANIPVLQLSIDITKPAEYHYSLAKQLADLRKKGVLIIGSGNMVHNLGKIDWRNINVPNHGFDWAQEINEIFKSKILKGEHKLLIQYQNFGNSAKLAIPTPDHYLPLIYALALQDKNDDIEIFNDKFVGGSLTMTSVKISNVF
jgi:4,5-DOPA dioxygenase extradiol